MVESASILRFLADKFELHHLYPTDPAHRFTVDSILDQSGTSLRPALIKALRRVIFRRLNPIYGEKPSKQEKESLLAAAHTAMTKLEQQISKQFIAADHLTIADIQVFYELTLFRVMFHHDLEASHNHLYQWYHRVAHSNPVLTTAYNEYLQTLDSIVAKIPVEEEEKDLVELYWNPISQPSRTLKTVLDIAIPEKYTLHIIDLFKGEQKSKEYLAKNPMGQVPALIVNGHSMNESASILRYIGEKY